MEPSPSRRTFCRLAGGFAATALTGLAADQPAASAVKRRVLRLAHVTDIHVEPERNAPAGMAAALRSLHRMSDPPELILFGGDYIMDALKSTKERAIEQWQVWKKVMADECSLPARFALGNHDVWGWELPDWSGLKDDPAFGKGLAMDMLGLRQRYYSFDQGGWHFIVLDSTHTVPEGGSGYVALLDDEQFAWLAHELQATPPDKPICVLSHIPLLAVCVLLGGGNEQQGGWRVSGSWLHRDARRIKDLFHRHSNVKLCLSGHMHMVDDVTYLGVRYCCNGAVCGRWWQGPFQEFAPAYAIVDLYADGTAHNQIVPYSV